MLKVQKVLVSSCQSLTQTTHKKRNISEKVRFVVFIFATLDAMFRRTKKPFEAEVSHFQISSSRHHNGAKAKRKENSHI